MNVPTLVLGAENDTFTPAWLSYELADHIPEAELLMIPKGSHAALLEQPELVELRIEKFLVERLNCHYNKSRSTKTNVKRSSSRNSKNRAAAAKKKASRQKTAASSRLAR